MITEIKKLKKKKRVDNHWDQSFARFNINITIKIETH